MMDVDTPTVAKRTRRGSYVFSGKTSALTLPQKRQVRSMISHNAELKYNFNSSATTAITNTYTISGVPFDIAQGVTDTQRVGDRLTWCGNLEINLQVLNGQGATGDIFNNLRVIVFQWHPNQTPTAALLLLNGPSGVPDIYSVFNHDNRQMYTVVHDRVYKTVGNANAATTPNTNMISTGVRRYKINLRKKRYPSPFQSEVQFVAGGATATNRMFVALVSDSALATHPSFTAAWKMFFRDS